jgi:hypothetical protein
MKCVINGATISPCGKYRTRLWRIWEDEKPRMLLIMLNPSSATATEDDPTIRRGIGFAKREGCGGLEVVNLYSYRTKSPKVLWDAARADVDIGGPNNRETILSMLRSVDGPIVCGWGTHGDVQDELETRILAARADKPLHHLGPLNAGGTPKHPLYLPANAPLVRWLPAGEEEMPEDDELCVADFDLSPYTAVREAA